MSGGKESNQFWRNWTGDNLTGDYLTDDYLTDDYLTGAYARMLSLSFTGLSIPSLDRVAALRLSRVASLAVLLAKPNRGHIGVGTVVSKSVATGRGTGTWTRRIDPRVQ